MDEDDSDDFEYSDEETLKKVETSKKQPAESAIKTPVTDKMTKVTQQKPYENKSHGRIATPHPANKPNQQTPKFRGLHSCKSYERKFGSEQALESHTKAKPG